MEMFLFLKGMLKSMFSCQPGRFKELSASCVGRSMSVEHVKNCQEETRIRLENREKIYHPQYSYDNTLCLHIVSINVNLGKFVNKKCIHAFD